jgi:ATP-dependent DNA helicase DinG
MKIYSIDDWKKYFPHDEPRKEQITAIDFILDAFYNNDKHIAILGAETGCGKSAIAITIMRYMIDNPIPNKSNNETEYKEGGYILTTQKILQEQYMNDFGGDNGDLVTVKSSDNYTCSYFKQQSCAESRRMLKIEPPNSKFAKNCKGHCVYSTAKRIFLDSRESITNYSYFLAETVYAGKIRPRSLLVLDECHNICSALQNFVEISFSERFASMLGINMPEINTAKQAIRWIKLDYSPAVLKYAAKLESQLQKHINGNTILKETEIAKLARQYEKIDKHSCKVERFTNDYDEENWVFDSLEAQDRTLRKLEFKPIDVSKYADDLLFKFGEHIIMMSATVLNKTAYCKSLNIDETDTEFISIESPFPIKNRPVIYAPSGKMSKDNIDATLPQLKIIVETLLQHHKNDKGLIHATTYKISNYLKKNIKSRRLIVHNSENRQEMLEKHINSNKATVLMSPSMTEGIDLYDELSRFQIICKVPYPYLGDKVVRKRMRKWDWWYSYETSKTIIQAMGRSVRNINDECVTYILDEDFEYFYKKNLEMFPKWFHDALKV